MTSYREVEMKLFVPDLAGVRDALEKAGARLSKPRVYERNVRYEDEASSLGDRGITLRLRQDTRARLTYKESGELAAPDGIQRRFEAEVEVSDFDAMETILTKLGYHAYLTYEKYRTTYEKDGCEITLDEMPYGNFVEIEGEEGAIRALQMELGLTDAPNFRGSYTALFTRVREALGLPFTDLTFENFAGVVVSPEAFEARD